MTHNVLLNNVDHKDLRISTRRAAELGDAVMSAITFATEFRNLQAHYPIVFHKSPDGASFVPLALMGFEEGHNLFLGPNGWDANYLPLTIEREPFLIGRADAELVVHVDLDSPRIGAADDQAVFLPHGGATEFLQRINSVLLAIHEGLQGTPSFIAALLEHQLLEPFVFDIELNDGSTHRLEGFYTIHEERLAQLDGAALERLSRDGHLQAIYMAVASLSNLRALVERRTRLHALDC